MLVRIRCQSPGVPTVTHLTLAAAALLMPFALVSFTVALWAFAAELRWTADFFLAGGLLAHWQIWLAIAAILLLLARLLANLGAAEDSSAFAEF